MDAINVRISLIIICLSGVTLFLSGCGVGYKKIDGKWSYVTWNEANGYQSRPLEVDDSSFIILEDKKYAKDKNKVYYDGDPIPEADPSTYILLDGDSYIRYAKDKNKVFLLYSPIINADSSSFSVIKFPYSKDKNTVYCGTLPMKVNKIDEFEVIKPGDDYNITDKSHFIRFNTEYSYLKDIPVDTVISSTSGEARTKTEYFRGCKKK